MLGHGDRLAGILDESDTKYVYDDPFDSKGEKIKESKLLIDELDLPSDFLPSSEYDSFLSEDFPRLMLCPQPTTRTRFLIWDFDPPLYELPFLKEVFDSETLLSFSSENEEKVFKPGILTSKGVHSSLIPKLSHRGNSWILKTCAKDFVLQSSFPRLHLGIIYPNLID
nr:hypothetical protein [Tanacetum cinerariifolium]